MTFKFAPDGHQTAAAFCGYEERDNEAVTGSREFIRADKNFAVLGRETMEQVTARLNDIFGGRVRVRDGLNCIFTIPETVMVAMKANGLLDTREQLRDVFEHCLAAGLRAIARHTVAATTRGGRRVYLPVDPEFLIGFGHNTRAGRLEGAANVFMGIKGNDRQSGRLRSIDTQKVLYAQGEAQAAFNAALGGFLKDKGVLVLPHGKSISAYGVAKPQPARQQAKPSRTKKAGVGPQLKTGAQSAGAQQGSRRKTGTASAKRTKKIPKNAGPQKRKRVAKANARATPKQVLTFAEAWNNLVGVITADIRKTGVGLLNSLEDRVQRRMTRKAIKAAFRYHQRAGFARFAEGSVKAFALQLTTPHVRPDLFEKEWKTATAQPSRFGVNEAKVYPNGYRLFAPTSQLGTEDRVADRLIRLRGSSVRGLETGQVLGSLLRHNVGGDIADVLELCGNGGLRWASQYAPNALKFAAHAYAKSGHRVHVVGDSAVGKQLGQSAFRSAAGFMDSATRTSHARSLWLGLREKGPFGDWLAAAGEIRRTAPRVEGDPALDVERLHLGGGELLAEVPDERVELLAVEAAGVVRAVLERGPEELGVQAAEGVGEGDAGGDEPRRLFAGGHELVVPLERRPFLLVEADLLAVELDVPGGVRLLEERFAEFRHGGNLNGDQEDPPLAGR